MKKILISIPAFNEEKTIGILIKKIKSLTLKNAEISILVVDDGSTDKTHEIALSNNIILIRHEMNLGLGRTFRTAVKYACDNLFDIMVTIDGDGQFDPLDISKLVEPIMNNEADFVTASRFRNKDFLPSMPPIKRWGNHRVAKLINRISGLNMHDVSCGFRAYSLPSLLSLDLIGDYTYTHEAILILAFRGMRLREVDVKVEGERRFGKSKVAKSVFQYGFNSSLIILRYIRDYKPLKLFGLISVFFLLLGLLCIIYFAVSSVILNEFYPKFIAFIGAFLIIWAALMFIVGLVADMFTRIRIQIEEIRKQIYKKNFQ